MTFMGGNEVATLNCNTYNASTSPGDNLLHFPIEEKKDKRAVQQIYASNFQPDFRIDILDIHTSG